MEIARVNRVSKAFGGVRALVEVDMTIQRGEVHALCGENGAGKSTLIKILSGLYAPDEGDVIIAGRALPHGVQAANELGVSVIHQESVACHDLDAVDNVFVGREPRRFGGLLLDRASMERQTRELMSQLGEVIDIARPVGELPLAQRQLIGIARALSQQCRLLIMDEPTASLSARESEALFRIIRQLRAQGVSVLYVSHRLEEIFSLADRVTVLRDGSHVATRLVGDLSPRALIELMVGREIEPLGPDELRRPGDSANLLEICGLTRVGAFDDVSLTVQAGEVVGLAGLVGAGRTELANAIFGLTSYDTGRVSVHGAPLRSSSVAASLRRGLALVPEDRQHLGLVLPMSAAENLSLIVLRSLTRWGLIRNRAEQELTSRLASEVQVRAAHLSLPAEALSGGNQQKLVLGKWLAACPRVLILDEPTRGVDVAAKSEIHRRIRQLASQGLGTLLISSELPEILRLCDRILVMREGRIAGELSREAATEQKVLELALPDASAVGGVEKSRHKLEAAAERSPLSGVWRRRETWLVILIAITLAFVAALKPSFLSPANLLDIAADAAPTAIIACAVTLVIITGEIDISVGSIVGLTAALLGLCCYGPSAPMSVPLGVACALCMALVLGAVNGLLITLGRVPSIIATLGMLTVLRGITKLIMQGTSIDGRPEMLRDLATGKLLGVPNSVCVAAIIAVVAGFVARRTPLGRRIYAVGSNPKAAPLLGVSAGHVKFTVFALSGLMAGLAAVVLAPKNSIIQPNLGEGLELLVVTCVVVGGTSIRGGRGTIGGTMLAVLLLSLVPTALTYIGAPPQWRLAIQGAFILAAVTAEHFLERRRDKGGVL